MNEVVDDRRAYDAAVIEVVDDGDGDGLHGNPVEMRRWMRWLTMADCDGLQQPPPFSPPPGQKRNLCSVAVSVAVLKMLKKEVT